MSHSVFNNKTSQVKVVFFLNIFGIIRPDELSTTRGNKRKAQDWTPYLKACSSPCYLYLSATDLIQVPEEELVVPGILQLLPALSGRLPHAISSTENSLTASLDLISSIMLLLHEIISKLLHLLDPVFLCPHSFLKAVMVLDQAFHSVQGVLKHNQATISVLHHTLVQRSVDLYWWNKHLLAYD